MSPAKRHGPAPSTPTQVHTCAHTHLQADALERKDLAVGRHDLVDLGGAAPPHALQLGVHNVLPARGWCVRGVGVGGVWGLGVGGVGGGMQAEWKGGMPPELGTSAGSLAGWLGTSQAGQQGMQEACRQGQVTGSWSRSE